MTEKRTGLGIGVICNGNVPIKWMIHQLQQQRKLPGGLYWNYLYAIGDFQKEPWKNYATQRTEIVRKAREMNLKWLFFLDSDVFMPFDAISRLMSHEKDIVTGVYWKKHSDPPEPVIYKNMGDGPIWKINPGELIEIGGAGLGCTLINMDVFDKFDEAGIPHFKQDWSHQVGNRTIHVDIGEDHYFFQKARELGYKVWCDTNVLCDHYDSATDTFWPGEDEVKRIANKKIMEKKNHKVIDKDKPTIVFWNRNNVPFNGKSIEEKPIAGSETALINMAKEMHDLGWNAVVFCNCDKPGIYDGVSYNHYDNINAGMKELNKYLGRQVDVFVSSRDIRPFGGRPPAEKTVLWLHDMPDENIKQVKSPQFYENIDHIFVLSEFHKKSVEEYIGESDKFYITRNGIKKERFDKNIKKIPGKCIYCTTPFRGLDVLLGMWLDIKKQVPWATLHIYSGMDIYNEEASDTIKYIFDTAKKLKDYDVVIKPPIKQDELAEEIMSSQLMLYPNHFLETYCITAIESHEARTPIITSRKGALPEVVSYGKLIDGDPYSEEYHNEFVKEAVNLLQGNTPLHYQHRDSSWYSIAKEWEEFLKNGTKKV